MTTRQLISEIRAMLERHLTPLQIAHRLGISVHTINSVMSNFKNN